MYRDLERLSLCGRRLFCPRNQIEGTLLSLLSVTPKTHDDAFEGQEYFAQTEGYRQISRIDKFEHASDPLNVLEDAAFSSADLF